MELITEQKVMLLGMACVFLLFSTTQITYGQPYGETSDNVFHMVNKKALESNDYKIYPLLEIGSRVFGQLTKYPLLYYLLPGGIILIEQIFSFLLIPLAIYLFSGIFIREKRIRSIIPLIWLASGVAATMNDYYAQTISIFMIIMFLYFWIKEHYVISFLFGVLIPFGHMGSILPLLSLCFFCFIVYLGRLCPIKKKKRGKKGAMLPFFTIGIGKEKSLIVISLEEGFRIVIAGRYVMTLKYLMLGAYRTLSDYFLLGLMVLGIRKIRNKGLYTMLLIYVLPSVLFSHRGWFILFVFSTIAIAKAIPFNTKAIIYPLFCMAIIVNANFVGNYMNSNSLYFEKYDEILEFYNYNGTYCLFPDAHADNKFAPSIYVMKAWVKYDIPVKYCSLDRLIEVYGKLAEMYYKDYRASLYGHYKLWLSEEERVELYGE